MIKNIVFDFDGTIADSMDAILNIVNKNSKKYGFEKLSDKKINFLMGKGAKYLLGYLKIPSYKVPFLLYDIKSKLQKETENLKPFSNMPSIIKKLRSKDLNLGILTTNSRKNVEKFLKKNDLEHFGFIYHGTSLFGKDKMLKKMLKERKLKKEETVYVGDEDRDIEAAKKAGIKSIAVTWGFNSKKLLESKKPDFIVARPADLLETILNS